MRSLLSFCIVLSIFTGHLAAQNNRRNEANRYPPSFEGAKEIVYKKIGNDELKMYLFAPSESAQPQPAAKPAIVFFFGGGWTNGSPNQFEQQCRYLASRGMIAITADYRVASRQKVKAVECVKDAKSAIRYVREHASELASIPTASLPAVVLLGDTSPPALQQSMALNLQVKTRQSPANRTLWYFSIQPLHLLNFPA